MAMNLRKNQAPLYIKVHEIDNTAIIVNDGGLPKGTVFSCGLVLEEDVPQGHKWPSPILIKGTRSCVTER